ncbi:MAG: hypothetical protein H6686_02835 [Fibrobacteria bacterium]|nr:hypothetical protein [Fibrobacteria bacterium]
MRTEIGLIAAVVLLVGCSSAPVYHRTGETPSVRLSIHAADTIPGPSRIRMLQLGRTDPVSGREMFIYVDSTPVFTNVDVLEAKVVDFDDRYGPNDFGVDGRLHSLGEKSFRRLHRKQGEVSRRDTDQWQGRFGALCPGANHQWQMSDQVR